MLDVGRESLGLAAAFAAADVAGLAAPALPTGAFAAVGLAAAAPVAVFAAAGLAEVGLSVPFAAAPEAGFVAGAATEPRFRAEPVDNAVAAGAAPVGAADEGRFPVPSFASVSFAF